MTLLKIFTCLRNISWTLNGMLTITISPFLEMADLSSLSMLTSFVPSCERCTDGTLEFMKVGIGEGI